MSELVLTKPKKEKLIFHIDGDAFFVAVEIAKNPKLKGLPVVTGEEKGIVSAFSYEAKALGIVRGMPIFKVKRDYPDVLILAGDYKSYVHYSEMMFNIVRRYADDVEEYSIDECFADLTGLDRTLKMTHKQIAERIKHEVNDELGLSVSIGLAPTKVLAKVASKWVKPDGLTIIESNNISNFLLKTPIQKIWGIGPKTSDLLNKKKIFSAQDFVDKNIEWIKHNLSKPYEIIWRELNGEYVMQIDSKTKEVYSSIQKTLSFHPATNSKIFLLSQLSKNIEDACKKARHYKLAPKRLLIFLKTQKFQYITHSIPLSSPTNAPEVLISIVDKYFKNIHKKGILYRTTGVILQDLDSDSFLQNDLFGGTAKIKKLDLIHKQIDTLENKLGKRLVYLASTHNALNRKIKGVESDDLDHNLLFI